MSHAILEISVKIGTPFIIDSHNAFNSYTTNSFNSSADIMQEDNQELDKIFNKIIE